MIGNGRGEKGKKGRIEPVFTPDFASDRKKGVDLRLTAEDRPTGKATSKSQKQTSAKAKKSAARRKTASSKRTRGGRKQRARARSSFGFFGLVRRSFYWTTVLGIWAGIGVVGVLAYFVATMPHSNTWKVPDRPPNVRIVAIDGSLIANRGITGGEAVPLHEMPIYLPNAIIAIEDHRFYDHFGFDIIGFTRAMATNVVEGRVVQGGSSITQQLAKNLFLEPDRTVERKIRELILALWLETQYSKEQILEFYLNRVYFGAGAYGVDAAAQRYFGKSARDVTLGEAATLAGLVKAPSRLAPSRNPEGAKARARLVLAAMEREDFISARERELALEIATSEVPKRKTGAQHYIADWVMDVLPRYVGDVSEDVIVDTTIDRHLQVFAQQAIKTGLEENGSKLGVSQGALVSIDGIGAIRAMVGGRDYGESQFNRAVRAKRQPGSSFKPFVYLAAVEYGMTPNTVRRDRPVSFNGWAPKNFSNEYEGDIRLREALAKSLNTIAAQLAHEVGARFVVEAASRLGIQSPIAPNLSLSLGTSEVTPFELATAYVPFSNGGYRIEPFVVKRVVTREGRVLYDRSGNETYKQVIDPVHLGMMNAMMSETLVRGTGKRAALRNWPAGGKTGTSQEFRDAWFAGYTANLTTVVWVGNDDNSPTQRASGGNLPAEIWKDFMEEAHRGIPVADLPGRFEDQIFAGNLPEDINDVTERTIISNNVGGPQVIQANDERGGIRGLLSRIFGGN